MNQCARSEARCGRLCEGAVPITLRINGREDHKLNIDPRTTLLDCIRETVALTGTKKGVTMGNAAHARCMSMASACFSSQLALMHDGEEITTVEGLGTPDAMHPMQPAFWPAMAINAATAHQGRSCRRWRCSRSRAVQTTQP